MRLALILALLMCLASPTVSACEWPASNGDVFFDVRVDVHAFDRASAAVGPNMIVVDVTADAFVYTLRDAAY